MECMGGPRVYEALCFSKRNLAQLEHLQLQRIQLLLKPINNFISGLVCNTCSRGRSGRRRSGQAFQHLILSFVPKSLSLTPVLSLPHPPLSLGSMVTFPPPQPFEVVAFVERCHSNSLVLCMPATYGLGSRNSRIFSFHL